MYLNVEELETALQVAETNHPTIVQRLVLPNVTHQGRSSHAVKIASASGSNRIGVYFVAGVHAREWVLPDALINFIEVVANAYHNNIGITIGSNSFAPAQIQSIVSILDIFVFPLANPDGRHFTQNGPMGSPISANWRKNRRGNGVDINRNFDYLWDYPVYFSPSVIFDGDGFPEERPIANSQDSESEVFIGEEPASEAETQNIVHIVDTNPNIRFFIDVHSYGQQIFINWGNDEAQTSDVNVNFRNPVYNGQRGIEGDTYKEYLNVNDDILRTSLANSMRDAIQGVRGSTYNVQTPFDSVTVAGTSADYMNSRNYVDPSLQKVHGFGMECGTGDFQPPLPERAAVINEVTAALIRFCIEVVDLPSDIFIRDNLQDSGEEPLVSGGISRSPDINHYRQELADPTTFLGSSVAKIRGDLFETVEIGQSNYIYVRLQNRGYKVDNAEVDIYWMPPSTLPTPASWNLIGTIPANNIQPGEFRVAGPLEWNSIPDRGHYCFVGVISTTTEPRLDLSTIRSIDDFYHLVRRSNNVTWKNFDVDNMFAGGMSSFYFQIQGWRRVSIESDLEIDLSELSVDSEVELKILKRLTENVSLDNISVNRTSGLYRFYDVSSARVSKITALQLRSSDNVQAVLRITLPENIPDGSYDIAVIQKVGGREMGRITKRLNVGQFPFIANRRTRELHRKNCPWIPKMSSRNKVPYGELELGLKHGYDGCHTCLNEFDHG